MTSLNLWLKRPATLFVVAGFLAAFLTLSVFPAHAEDSLDPWQDVTQIRDLLFAAQSALLAGDLDSASAAVHNAEEAYLSSGTASSVASLDPQLNAAILARFDQAAAAVIEQSLTQLTLQRSQILTFILSGSYELTLQAIQSGDLEAAVQWLHVREYRPPTRFSRASADATLALSALAKGELESDQALAQVRADLLDTYQFSIGASLASLRDALQLGLHFRAADATGSIYGYWLIIGQEYSSQFGQSAYNSTLNHFEALLAAIKAGDEPAILQEAQAIEIIIQSFRAAPLTEAEQARRAGQMLRFLSLVPVEYGRGIKNGEVFLDIELQEAITFLAGAQAAFLDLRLNLEEMDAQSTASIAVGLRELDAILDQANRRQQVAEPQVIADSVSTLTQQLTAIIPEEWASNNAASDLDVLFAVLDQIDSAVAQGEYAVAESARLEAYALFDIALEPRLLAFAPDLAAELEGLFWQGFAGQPGLAQSINTAASPKELREVRASLDDALSRGLQVLGEGSTAPAVVVTNAAIIVFREGLEAVVIIAALMAGMAESYSQYRRPLAFGALLAVIATALTWWLARTVLANFSHYGERLEAVVSIIAIVVLLMITNWFFHKSYWTDWLASFHKMKYRLIQGETGQMLGLVLLGFSSIFREGFETVLFLQALVLDAGSFIVFQGVALGLVGVGIVGFIIFRLQAHLPYMRLFVITAFLIGGVLLILVGKTVHVMQAVAWMPISPVSGLSFPFWAGQWFGIYPTWESLIAQVLSLVFVVGSYYLAEFMRKRVRRQAREKASAS